MKKFLVLFCVLISTAHGSFLHDRDISKYGVIKVPVADAVRYPIELYGMRPKLNTVSDQYNAMPSSPDTVMPARVHQFLFNEIVEIIQEWGTEVKIRALNTYFLDENGDKQSEFWILKENLFCIANFLGAPAIPDPIENDKDLVCTKNILTLQMPFAYRDSVFSAGTRFLRFPDYDNPESYAIAIMDYEALNECPVAYVPKESAYVDYKKSKEERFADFIELIKKWASLKSKKIPFLWGGSSFDQLVEPGSFKLIDAECKGKAGKAWSRVDLHGNQIATGYDAAEITMRAMQIVGLPYFAKTTYTAQQELYNLKEDDTIKNGDFIWSSGGMLMVVDAGANQIVFAGGYQHWDGVLHLISVDQLFESISTLEDLKAGIFQGKEFMMLDKKGKPCKSAKGLKILRFII